MEQVFPSSEQDRRFLLEFVDACHTHPVTQFQQAVYPKLRHLLPHDMFMYGDTDALSNITQYVNVSFPQQYIDQVSAPYGSLVCPLAGRWTGALRPLYYNPCQAGRFVTRSKRYETLCDLSIGDIAIHGVPGCQTLRGSCYAFARLGDTWSRRFEAVLQLVVPHIHVVLTSLARIGATSESPAVLSPREYEVLRWIADGKTDAEIGDLLNISICTVRIHVRHIIGKFDAANRTHAVAKALRSGIITL